jgi:Spy/CpxP family protein refolding chaperone
MRKYFILATGIALFASYAVLAGEGGRPEGDRPRFHRPGPKERGLLPPHLLEDLSLSTEQRSQYDALNAQFRKERDQMFESSAGPDKSFREEVRAAKERGDEAKLDELRQKRHAQAEPFMRLRQKYMEQFRAILTPEQTGMLDAAKQRMQERRDRFEQHRDEDSPRRPPQ